MHWMRHIIEKKGLDLGLPDVDTSGTDRKSPDIVIYESRRSQNVLCVIEAKPPYYDDVFNYEHLKKPAWDKANARRAKYFATTNFKELIWFSTQKANAQQSDEIIDKYHLSELENLDLIEETRYKESIIRQLDIFLTKLYAVHTGKEPEPKLAIDELLIYRIHDKILRLARYYTGIIEDKCHKDTAFAAQLGKWFNEQGWDFVLQPQDFDKTARQAAYLLVNKILFYETLQAKRPQDLAPLEIPKGLFKGAQLQKRLQNFFEEVLEIDYKTIYTADFIDNIAFLDSIEVVQEIRDLVNILHHYDFAKLGYDIIGRIFERLIPAEERHNLGQYFTNPDVVDIIIEFCLQGKDDKAKIFDPSCGAGTFLVRAYQHKKLMNQYQKHEDILGRLWGNDIAKFPAHLATINLAINDLASDKNYPSILQEDFFDLLSTEGGFEVPRKWRRARATALHLKEREVEYPRWFDCVVGNPPYTRQEEISKIAPKTKEYKGGIIDKALTDNKGRKIAEISRRAGIYAYFFIHGTKFLQNGGRFGFIVSNSWLDVDYGKGLQEFFLNNYKIITIIESKVERWFEDADINTCIVILEKCSGEDRRRERYENIVRFVYLKKQLRYFIPAAQDIWDRQVQRRNAIQDKFIKTIMAHNEIYDDEDLRIFPKKQSQLWEEGYDAEDKKYVGSKWGKYLRAPDIFFKILERGKDKLVPLKQIAEVRFGIKTGANEFFYLTEEEIKRRGIEREYLQHIIFTLKEVKGYILDKNTLKFKVLMCHKDKAELKGQKVLKYILEGEAKGFHKRPTCSSRSLWYSLGKGWAYAPLIFPAKVGERMPVFLNSGIFEDKKLYGVTPKERNDIVVLAALLNSTLSRLFIEFTCRQLTGAQAIADIDVVVVENLLIFNPANLPARLREGLEENFHSLCKTSCESIFREIGATSPEEVSLGKIKPYRRELDKIIMGEILGLTDDEQLEVYRAVIDLVKSRLEKAKSFGKRKKTREGIDVDLLVKMVMEKVGDDTLGKFYQEKVLSQKSLYVKTLLKASDDISIKQSLLGWRLYSGKEYIECASELEARYLKVWREAGIEEIKVPKDENYLKAIVPELESLKANIDAAIEAHLSFIANPRTRDRILHQLWQEITK
jgi:type I restriction-modification system DNA methylase subunit